MLGDERTMGPGSRGARGRGRDLTLAAHRDELLDFVDNVPVCLHWLAADGTILWANRAELELLGSSAEELVGRHVSELHVDRRACEEMVRTLASGLPVDDVEARLRAKDGSIRDVLIAASAVVRDGVFVHARVATRDITRRRRLAVETESRAVAEPGAERLAALKREAEQLRGRSEMLYGLVRAVMDAASIDDVYAAALDTIEQTLGPCRSAILAYGDEDRMRFKAWRGLSASCRTAIDGHSPWNKESKSPAPIVIADVEHDAASAAHLPVLRGERVGAVAFVPLMAGGQLLGELTVYYDQPRELSDLEVDLASTIANHVGAAMARFSAEGELRRSLRLHEVFTGVLGHDLRNPLSAMLMGAQVIEDEASDQTHGPIIKRMRRSGERMARTIDQLLDLTRIRLGGALSVSPVPGQLIDVIWESIDELSLTHPGQPVSLGHFGGTAGSWDRDRLVQLFSNVIGNALAYGTAGCTPSVHVDGRAADCVRITIHNRGAIPQELLPTLLEPLGTASEKPRSRDGLGLGLYIASAIARAHGGTLDVHSSEADGTTISVKLPRRVEGHVRPSDRPTPT